MHCISGENVITYGLMKKNLWRNIMKKKTLLFTCLAVFVLAFFSFAAPGTVQGEKEPVEGVKTMPEATITKVINALTEKCGQQATARIEKGVRQVARLWRKSDGCPGTFEKFCMQNFFKDEAEREIVFKKMSGYYEVLWGNLTKITLDLKKTLDLDIGPIYPIDEAFGSYSPSAHLDDDFFNNKIAFIAALNYPFYSLAEKKELGPNWSRKEWAYARLGDVYYSRVPAELWQKFSEINTRSDVYISDYNIFMGHVFSKDGKKLFPEDLKLLSHWNLRDQLKADYALKDGLEKQKIIYKVMQRIIDQDIPGDVVNNPKLDWNPFTNKVYRNGTEISCKPEPNTRYLCLLDNFKALKAMDPYCPQGMETYIKRQFDGSMEISQEEVESVFIEFLSCPQVKKVARLIQKRLKRKLQPFDIWYDGFKARSGVPEEKLNAITRKKYPTPKDLEKDFPNILMKLGFTKEKAEFLSSKIVVDPARGSGHAWGAEMHSDKSHLRTRVPASGMNYKGYNIAVHEFGHNVEQTISLHDVDYYMMHGVPNTAFTEALAFLFQDRDLELLGIKESNPDKKYLDALDTFWSAYEGMGVSVVDMRVWKWLYAHPEASVEELRDAVISIAKDVWNKYYARIFGAKDQSILAIYSHMIGYPLYLSAYSYGDLIKFQINAHVEGQKPAAEIERMFSAGRLIPQLWMKNAVGSEISTKTLITAAEKALKHIKK